MRITIVLSLLLLIAPGLTISAIAKENGKKRPDQNESSAKGRTKPKKSRALIIHTGGSNSRGKGSRSSKAIRSYLGHFGIEAEVIEARNYSPGLMDTYRWIFYVGSEREKVNKDLARDVESTTKKVVWIDNNVRQLDPSFFRLGGFTVKSHREKSRLIDYKDTLLPPGDKTVNRIKIANPKRNIVYSKVFLTRTKSAPYIINSRNFWYIADNPFAHPKDGGAYMVFADILHNVIEDHPHERQAVIRIDGVNPRTDPEQLRTLINFLHINQMPFAISVTPVFKKNGAAAPVRLHKKTKLTKVIKEAEEKGGVIVLNGYAHQLKKKTGTEREFGAIEGLTVSEVRARTTRRLQAAQEEMKRSGFTTKFWHTPFYQAAPADYQVFRRNFRYAFERSVEPPPPYKVGENAYGQLLVQENLGLERSGEAKKNRVSEKAWRMRVVRDAYAGFTVKPETDLAAISTLVEKMQEMNYEFVSPRQVVGLKTDQAPRPFFMDKALFQFSFRTENIMSHLGWALLPVAFFSYYLVIFGLSRRIRPRKKEENPDLFFVFIVPALNEGKVIRKTLKKLAALKDTNYMVLAMNDNSSDNTKSEIKKVKSEKIKLLNIRPPDCQHGKGNVLNIAYRYILNDSGLTKKYALKNIIFGVVDSDGGVDPEILPAVSPYFNDERSASVQTAVRIENCDQNIWTRWQDFEFRVFTFLFQSAREQLGSVGLGGNGQFIRLSALCELGEAPWTSCLTEDLDIGIRLILNGKRNHFCSTSYVNQQAVPRFWPLVKQRTRWFQGHVQCWRHLGPVAVYRMPLLAKIDITYYLLSISLALVIVPANFVLAIQTGYLAANPELFRLLSATFGIKIFAYWYFIYFGAMPIFTYSYWQTKKQSFPKAVIMSHLFLFVSFVWLIAGYLAIFRLFRRTTSWHKTGRYVEPKEETQKS